MKIQEPLKSQVFGISNVQIENVAEILKSINQLVQKKEVILQLVDADKVAGEEHLQIASYHAQKAFQQETPTSNSIGIETLLYATGQRQIAKALTLMGITTQTKNVAVIIYSPPPITNHSELVQASVNILKGTQSKKVLELTPQKEKTLIQLFEITPEELQNASLPDLLIERMAMLELTKKPPIDSSKS